MRLGSQDAVEHAGPHAAGGWWLGVMSVGRGGGGLWVWGISMSYQHMPRLGAAPRAAPLENSNNGIVSGAPGFEM